MYYTKLVYLTGFIFWVSLSGFSQKNQESGVLKHFSFEDSFEEGIPLKKTVTSFVEGLEGKALKIKNTEPGGITIEPRTLSFNKDNNFSLQFWIKTTADSEKPMVLISQKDFFNSGLSSQKAAGWVIYMSNGTWAWNMGSGSRRVTYERSNGKRMPLNDGDWHQITMTYNVKNSLIQLYYDGINRAIYNIHDSSGFDFTNENPLIIGTREVFQNIDEKGFLQDITLGRENLQSLVNEFNALGFGTIGENDFESLIVDPKELLEKKIAPLKINKGTDSIKLEKKIKNIDFTKVEEARSELKKNPFTIYQVADFMKVAPLFKIYNLTRGKIIINKEAAMEFTDNEKLYPPDFTIDNLRIWNSTLSSEEILNSYSTYFKPEHPKLAEKIDSLTTGVWNIHHGGTHKTINEDGWDSRVRIAEILKEEDVDIIMMQETYSNGDYIAAELGYYFATTIDWDYLNQGSNVSILSRYPIEELSVPEDAAFMNIAAKLQIAENQKIYVMSNWYGMNQFSTVFNFHQDIILGAKNIPVLFGGDFNAVPYSDGGDSPASIALLEAGFTDAYRSFYPNVNNYPGPTHTSGRRIDQLYFKGKGMINTSTKIISDWPDGFPSDHALIISKFILTTSGE